MNIELRDGNLAINESLTIEDVKDAWNLILKNLSEIKTVDLNGLKDLDLAGMQVLLMLVHLKQDIKFIMPPTQGDPRFVLYSSNN
ncbi:hypothetical protein [Thermosediminibacter litoriperuensis]|uniref:STAS domain-containing protein n=1 Tax=Thermosediminibacter litoriperuensis TaxID=291989 RepID=A0A5S5AUL9_9FIRM|nr:hypothetical protein [Thermosediminibacter litoriperuensis]TYP56135.1 hypothetical protein LZ11_01058 [Thermosediminibacter litoriperuensis]